MLIRIPQVGELSPVWFVHLDRSLFCAHLLLAHWLLARLDSSLCCSFGFVAFYFHRRVQVNLSHFRFDQLQFWWSDDFFGGCAAVCSYVEHITAQQNLEVHTTAWPSIEARLLQTVAANGESSVHPVDERLVTSLRIKPLEIEVLLA